jgi:hypothetical protein
MAMATSGKRGKRRGVKAPRVTTDSTVKQEAREPRAATEIPATTVPPKSERESVPKRPSAQAKKPAMDVAKEPPAPARTLPVSTAPSVPSDLEFCRWLACAVFLPRCLALDRDGLERLEDHVRRSMIMAKQAETVILRLEARR